MFLRKKMFLSQNKTKKVVVIYTSPKKRLEKFDIGDLTRPELISTRQDRVRLGQNQFKNKTGLASRTGPDSRTEPDSKKEPDSRTGPDS